MKKNHLKTNFLVKNHQKIEKNRNEFPGLLFCILVGHKN